MQKAQTRRRSTIARVAVLAMVLSLVAVALPASAHLEAIDTSATCPDNIPNAGFTDIGTFDATTQRAINCLAHFGITKGTSATTFSPSNATPRWQMALFLIRQAAAHGLTIPAATDQGFTDISGQSQEAQDAINQLAALGLTKGTSATTFSPNLIVSRWQMALFIHRLAVAAGVTFTDDPAHSEFTDISGQLAEAQTAINALADAHIALGIGGGLFGPEANVLRWQMALFLTRLLAADGILPSGLGFVVVACENNATVTTGADEIAYDDAGTKKVSYAAATSFLVDNAAVSKAVFEANCSIGDLIAFSGGTATAPATFSLTNQTQNTGLVNDVNIGGDTFDIVSASGALLNGDPALGAGIDYTPAAGASYTVGGSAVTLATFEANLSNGDTITITPATTTSLAVFALTNGTATGTVSGFTAPDAFNVTTAGGAVLGVNDISVQSGLGDALVLTVDGSPVTEANFNAALSNGDAVSWSRASGVTTAALTNAAPAAQTGRVLSWDTALDTITFDAGPATAVTTSDYDPAAAPFPTIRIDGVVSTAAELEAALNIGDTVTFQPADTATSTGASISLTNDAAPLTGLIPATVNTATDTVTFWFDANGPASAPVTYTDNVASATHANIVNAGFAGNTNVVWQINGSAAASEAAFEAALNGIATGGLTGSVTISDSGTNTIWNVISP